LRDRLIQRYEHNYFAGWVVAVKREGRRYPAKYFSDKPDGRRAAFARARRYRDGLLALLPKPHKLKRTYCRNRTGVVGVARVKERTRAGNIAVRYVATWPVEDRGGYRRAKIGFWKLTTSERIGRSQLIRGVRLT
jgi:hypothetical protein